MLTSRNRRKACLGLILVLSLAARATCDGESYLGNTYNDEGISNPDLTLTGLSSVDTYVDDIVRPDETAEYPYVYDSYDDNTEIEFNDLVDNPDTEGATSGDDYRRSYDDEEADENSVIFEDTNSSGSTETEEESTPEPEAEPTPEPTLAPEPAVTAVATKSPIVVPVDPNDLKCVFEKTLSINTTKFITTCQIDCTPPPPPPVEPKKLLPLQLVFLIDTSDSMQGKNMNKISYWIYTMVRRLQKPIFSNNGENTEEQNLERNNFVVVVQFADHTYLEYANEVSVGRLDMQFQNTLNSIVNNQQETTTNTFQALSDLVDLMDVTKTDEKIVELDSGKLAANSSSIDTESWKTSIKDAETKKLLFVITDGKVRDDIDTYDDKHDGNLIAAVGKSFDRIDLLIVKTKLEEVNADLRGLAKYGYLDVWSNPTRILSGIEDMAASIHNQVTNQDTEIEVVFVLEKSFCQCNNLAEAEYRYNHVKQFVKKIASRFYRNRGQSSMVYHLFEYFAALERSKSGCNVSSKKNSQGGPSSSYWKNCCTNQHNVMIDEAKSFNKFKESLRTNGDFFSANAYTCSEIDIDYMIEEAMQQFKCKEEGKKKCHKMMVMAFSGDYYANIWLDKNSEIKHSLIEQQIDIVPIKIGKWHTSSPSEREKSKNFNVKETATFTANTFSFIDHITAPSGTRQNSDNLRLALSQMTDLLDIPVNKPKTEDAMAPLDPNAIICGVTCEAPNDQVQPPAGRCGFTGPKGPDGLPGSVGKAGPDGNSGLPGDKGDPGNPGDDGAEGIPGLRGPRGHPGPAGNPGNNGSVGNPGDKGDSGDPGFQFSDDQISQMIQLMCTCTLGDCNDVDPPEQTDAADPICMSAKIQYVVDATESIANNLVVWQRQLSIAKTLMKQLVTKWIEWVTDGSHTEKSDYNPVFEVDVHVIGLRNTQDLVKSAKFVCQKDEDNSHIQDPEIFATSVYDFLDGIDSKERGGSIQEMSTTLLEIYKTVSDQKDFVNIMLIVSDSFAAMDLKQFCSDELTTNCQDKAADGSDDHLKYHSPKYIDTSLVSESVVQQVREKTKNNLDFIREYSISDFSKNDVYVEKAREYWMGLFDIGDNKNRYDLEKLTTSFAITEDTEEGGYWAARIQSEEIREFAMARCPKNPLKERRSPLGVDVLEKTVDVTISTDDDNIPLLASDPVLNT